jgi:cytochrome c oxidase subunit II
MPQLVRNLLLILFIFFLFLAGGCGSSSASNGQMIYFTSSSDSGSPITYSNGPRMMENRLTCVRCHGSEGHGGRIRFMMQSHDMPNITWPELTAAGSDHPAYNEKTLGRAITQGIEPDGNLLEYPMPKWQMSDSDLNDLIEFIKTLK